MDFSAQNPYNFVELLNSQQQESVPLFSTQASQHSSYPQDTSAERRERRRWTSSDDVLLISAWLNTSKDAVVANEQKSGAFWERIAKYFASCPNAEERESREPSHCKQRWHKINDVVCKFSGSYEAATRARASGQNEDDVLKVAHDIYRNDYKKQFTLEHAWRELKNDQKWCELAASKHDGTAKRRRLEEVDGVHSESSHAQNGETLDGEESSKRPPGVKASKARAKKSPIDATTLSQFQTIWAIKEKDMVMKEKDMVMKKEVSRMSLLESLYGKKEPLSESEEALKQKLISELLSN